MPTFTNENLQYAAGKAAEVVGYAALAGGVAEATKLAGFDSNVVDMAEMVLGGAVVTAAGQAAYDALEYREMLPVLPSCGGTVDYLWATAPEMLKNTLKQGATGLFKGGVAGVLGYQALKHLGGYMGVDTDTGLATAVATGAIAGALFQVAKDPVASAASRAMNSVASCWTAPAGLRTASVTSNPLNRPLVEERHESGDRSRSGSFSAIHPEVPLGGGQLRSDIEQANGQVRRPSTSSQN